ncbi:hypothetical protein [Streptomyces olivochromogenes]|uniref:Secreted protein n=1 Tax=Streptomyces olivochromogenes TaxID=1963 RepID=A0A250VIH2_STROL|nr:hypothetical protein [Streptomyces olivochromogenes]KUN43294.1 hypothetical protein AQJ27_32530 [Streptomyces olivochromogenes]GAX53993.1 hypothetical protein SO3561_05525 [Streptomyces olivochromogenes]
MLDTKRGALLLCSAVSASLMIGGMTPANADSADGVGSSDNVGELISIPAGESTAATYERVTHRAAEINARTTADKKCTGVWKHSVANVDWDRTPAGTVRWSFKLTARARANLGVAVTVTMPNAWVNNHAINPPYGPHSKVSTYDFHGSMNKYNRKGSNTKYTIKTKDKITFFWLIKSNSNPRAGATRYITCAVPPKGSS